MTVTVLASGPLATVQDLGRPGLGRMGVTASGAADRGSLILANHVLGNAEGAAAVETTFGGLRVRADSEVTVVVTGPAVPLTHRSGDGEVTAEVGEVVVLAAGDELRIGRPRGGLRNYLAVRGGFDVPAVLGSRSTDLLSGLGPSPVAVGQRLPVGFVIHPSTPSSARLRGVLDIPDPLVLSVMVGPRADWFTAESLELLFAQDWRVTPSSNRVGLRLEGAQPLERAVTGELPGEPMVPGALQVPPSGQPVLFLPDHPVTGGYPVIGVVDRAGRDLAGQARPGSSIRFLRS